MSPVSDEARDGRQARIERAIASVRLEGLEPTEAARAIFDRYVACSLIIEEMGTDTRIRGLTSFGIFPASSTLSTLPPSKQNAAVARLAILDEKPLPGQFDAADLSGRNRIRSDFGGRNKR